MSCLEEKSEGSSLIVRSAVMQQGSEMVINVLFFPPFFSRGSFCTGVLKKKRLFLALSIAYCKVISAPPSCFPTLTQKHPKKTPNSAGH